MGAAVGALLLCIPLSVLGQDRPAVVRPGDPDVPAFAGGSGRTIPAGAVEVVRAGPGSTRAAGSSDPVPLAGSGGAILDAVDGNVFSGPCELAVRGGVSYVLPEGSRARAILGKDGSITFLSLAGSVFARNRDVTVLVRTGGSVTSTAEGRFLGLTSGEVNGGGRWIGFSGEGGFGEIRRLMRDVTVFREIPPAGGAVSGSRGFR